MLSWNGVGDIWVCDCQDDTPIKTHLVHFTATVPLWIHATRMNTTHTHTHLLPFNWHSQWIHTIVHISTYTFHIAAYSKNILQTANRDDDVLGVLLCISVTVKSGVGEASMFPSCAFGNRSSSSSSCTEPTLNYWNKRGASLCLVSPGQTPKTPIWEINPPLQHEAKKSLIEALTWDQAMFIYLVLFQVRRLNMAFVFVAESHKRWTTDREKQELPEPRCQEDSCICSL